MLLRMTQALERWIWLILAFLLQLTLMTRPCMSSDISSDATEGQRVTAKLLQPILFQPVGDAIQIDVEAPCCQRNASVRISLLPGGGRIREPDSIRTYELYPIYDRLLVQFGRKSLSCVIFEDAPPPTFCYCDAVEMTFYGVVTLWRQETDGRVVELTSVANDPFPSTRTNARDYKTPNPTQCDFQMAEMISESPPASSESPPTSTNPVVINYYSLIKYLFLIFAFAISAVFWFRRDDENVSNDGNTATLSANNRGEIELQPSISPSSGPDHAESGERRAERPSPSEVTFDLPPLYDDLRKSSHLTPTPTPPPPAYCEAVSDGAQGHAKANRP